METRWTFFEVFVLNQPTLFFWIRRLILVKCTAQATGQPTFGLRATIKHGFSGFWRRRREYLRSAAPYTFITYLSGHCASVTILILSWRFSIGLQSR